MAVLQTLHNEVLALTPPDVLVAGVLKSHFAQGVKHRLIAVAKAGSLKLDTGIRALSVGVEIDYRTIDAEFDGVSGRLSLSLTATLKFCPRGNFGVMFRSREMTVQGAQFELVADPSAPAGVRFRPVDALGCATVAQAKGPPDAGLLAQYYAEDDFQYRVDEAAICLNVPLTVGGTLASFITFPKIKNAMNQFTLAPNISIDMRHKDYILLYSKPIVVQDPCPYVPRHDSRPLDAKARAALKTISQCGESGEDKLVSFIVVYPRATTIQHLGDDRIKVGLAVQTDEDASTTIDYYTYTLTALLTNVQVTFDAAAPSMTVDTTWQLSGRGEYGANVACGAARIPILSSEVDDSSSIKATIVVEPCVDDHMLYLKASWTIAPQVDLHWKVGGIGGTIVDTVMKAVLRGGFGFDVNKKMADAMQVPLIKTDGWSQYIVRSWSKNVAADSLLVAFEDEG